MAILYDVATRSATVTAVANRVAAGSANAAATIAVYGGTRPSTPSTAAGSSPLVSLNFNNPPYASTNTSTGTTDLSGGTALTATIATSGTATWFRVSNLDGVAIFDGDVGSDMTLSNTSLIQGGVATVSSVQLK